MRRKTLSIHCNHCNNILFRYIKIGKGHLIRCWKNRIIDSILIQKENNYYCTCGNLIGSDEQVWIKLKKQQTTIKK